MICYLSAAANAAAADKEQGCKLKCGERLIDKIEAFAMVGFGPPPTCANTNCCIDFKTPELKVITVGANAALWARLVYFDRLGVGIPNRAIDFDLLEIDGGPPPTPAPIGIHPVRTTTTANGFGADPIELSVSPTAAAGHLYVIRSTYSDGRSVSHSYGPYVFTSYSSNVSSADRDTILLKKLPLPGKCRT